MKSSDWEKRKDSWTLMFIKKKSNIISIGKNNSTFISRKFSKWKKQQKFFFSNFNTIVRSTKKAIIPYTQLKKDSNFAMFSLIFIEEQSNWIITQNYLQKRFQAKKFHCGGDKNRFLNTFLDTTRTKWKHNRTLLM